MTVKELELEIGLQIFMRSNRGIIITPEGEEFLGYARQVIDQYGILKARYVEKQRKEKFSVSMPLYVCGQSVCGDCKESRDGQL